MGHIGLFTGPTGLLIGSIRHLTGRSGVLLGLMDSLRVLVDY